MIAYVAKDLASGVRIAESGSAKALFGHPHHPYAVGLPPRGPAHRRRGDARVSAVPANATAAAGNGHETLVTIEDLRVHFPITSGIVFRHKVGAVYAVDGIDLEIRRGTTGQVRR